MCKEVENIQHFVNKSRASMVNCYKENVLHFAWNTRDLNIVKHAVDQFNKQKPYMKAYISPIYEGRYAPDWTTNKLNKYEGLFCVQGTFSYRGTFSVKTKYLTIYNVKTKINNFTQLHV